jgi:hypothetical protein
MGVPFSRLMRLKPGETVVFSWIVFKSRAHRDRVNAKVMKRPATRDNDGSEGNAVRRQAQREAARLGAPWGGPGANVSTAGPLHRPTLESAKDRFLWPMVLVEV